MPNRAGNVTRRGCQGLTLSLPCAQVVWDGLDLCDYHARVQQGLIDPSEPSLRPSDWKPARRPSVREAFERNGWKPLDVDLYESLVGRAGDGVL